MHEKTPPVLHGALAAAVTPLCDGGGELDCEAVGPLMSHYARCGLDGALLLGTTGEGLLMSAPDRQRYAELARECADPGFQVAVHCGAQTTDVSVELASHAASCGVDAVAAVAPPYYALDDTELLQHLVAVASACAPVPFYVYEFEARSGYAVPLAVLEQLKREVGNLRGMKVSDAPFDQFSRYLGRGLDIFVGPDGLIWPGLRGGASGVISGLGGGLPGELAAVLARPTEESCSAYGELRKRVNQFPFQAAVKTLLAWQGVPVRPDVRAPLRGLTEAEYARLRELGAELRLEGCR